MIIQPKVRGFICTTAHPVGTQQAVQDQINYVQSQPSFQGPKKVLIIGASTGYGLATRIVTTFGAGASTIGIAYEKPADEKRTASAGWYNTAAFEKLAHQSRYFAQSINGDAFSMEIKQQAASLIRRELKKVDLVVYSLAAPRRIDAQTQVTYSSVLKPINQSYTSKTVDPFRNEVKDITLEPATQEEIAATVKVMGGEDWAQWMTFLRDEELLADGVKTLAFSYIGPELTYAIYKNGTIGKAKEHLHATAHAIQEDLKNIKGQAFISVNKALVTQASAAIPVVPLYISLLYKIMKEKNIHEGCIEQIYRLFKNNLYADKPLNMDGEGHFRLDDLEMRPDVQAEIKRLWPEINSENLATLTDIEGYRNEFYRLFGFHIPGINYHEPVEASVSIESIGSV